MMTTNLFIFVIKTMKINTDQFTILVVRMKRILVVTMKKTVTFYFRKMLESQTIFKYLWTVDHKTKNS